MVQNHKSFVPNILFYQICQKFVEIFTKNMNGRSDKKIILYLFCSFNLLRKKVENNFFIRAAVLCANISQIFFSQFDHQKYLRCFFKSNGRTDGLTRMGAQNAGTHKMKRENLANGKLEICGAGKSENGNYRR